MTAATTARRRRWVSRLIPNLVLLVSAVFFIAPLLTLTRYALQNVPTVLLSSTYGSRAILDPFIASRYHRAGDEAADVELGGAIDDLLLHEALIRRMADPARYSPPPEAGP